jgi:hypothetical protein
MTAKRSLGWLVLVALLSSALSIERAVAAPAAFWHFSAEEETPLVAHGGVHRDAPGPRPPEYPDFESTNTAVKLDGSGARFSFDDPGASSPFDFTSGDEITIEGWLKIEHIGDNENRYVIGKGRTGAAGFARDNQNWALRIRGNKGQACISFLFATPPAPGIAKTDAHWHRWTSSDGFKPKTGWHHVAVTYRFGQPETIRGWIDGSQVKGAWDMGGATKAAPVVDNDAIWIGSALGGSAGNSFEGWLDAIAVHRVVLDDKTLQKRFNRLGGPVVSKPAPEVMPDLGPLPPGQVVATFHEGMPSHDRWLMTDEPWPNETTRWHGTDFLLPRLPLRYDAWGIRESWKAPVLVRLAADVDLPQGQQTILFRARGLSRLWIGGKLIGRTKPLTGSPSGEEPITPVAEPPLPGLRPAEHRLQETIAEIEVAAENPVRVVLETLAGGSKFRAEPGEVVVAIKTSDGQSYQVLHGAGASGQPLPLTDEVIESALAKIEQSLTDLDDQTRRTAAAARDDYWQQRHDAARHWAKEHPAPQPPHEKGAPSHPIDAFLAAKIDRALAEAAKTPEAEARHFHTVVLPILQAECFRCHGEKSQGGLTLNSRQTALKGGDSEIPAIVPGKAAESEMIARLRHEDADVRMPPTGKPLAAEKIAILEKWINDGAQWPPLPLEPEQTALAPLVDDAKFLRRAYLDTVGVPPTATEVRAFLADTQSNKRERLVERLLADPRWADHWISYWQDLLAENPTLINATLNSTGPFRWFLYDSLRDDKPLDRMVTDLVMMRGSQHDGGSAGFGMAAQNDAPLAAKGHVLASAFLGIELQCARCHDSPYHSTKQRDLYALSAMLARKPVTVPKTSSVPTAFFEKKNRESLIEVTLKPDENIAPDWPFAAATGADIGSIEALVEKPDDTRERLAALITAPENTRFAQVVANRIWRRLLGAGIVEPPHDWEGRKASHPELLDWLAHEFVAHDYSIKHLARQILTSQAYAREAIGKNLAAAPGVRFFNAAEPRRMSAEQIVDSFYAAAGQEIDVELLTLDPDGRRPSSNRQSFGHVTRAWMFVSLSNERDRPSLTLPRAAAITDFMHIFGWSAERQTPLTDRETEPNVLQPGVVANSPLTVTLTRASYGSPLAELAVESNSPAQIVDAVFLRFLCRQPTADERSMFAEALSEGFDDRLTPAEQIEEPAPLERLPQVTWSNHLRNEANVIQQEWERRTRRGPPADPRLKSDWREVYEDFVWSVVNLREFVWMP